MVCRVAKARVGVVKEVGEEGVARVGCESRGKGDSKLCVLILLYITYIYIYIYIWTPTLIT